MAIEFGCPVCGGTLRVEDDAVGQVVRCGGCMTMLRVPDVAVDASQFPSTLDSPFPDAARSPFPDTRPPSSIPSRSSTSTPGPVEEQFPPDGRSGEQPRPTRRRRSKRPPPTPPPGRSTFFWVLIIAGVLGVGSCVFCCGLIPLVTAPKWQEYQSSKGGFKVVLPADPKANLSVHGMKKDKKYEIEGTRIWARGEDYAVLYKEVGPAKERKGKDEDVFKTAEEDLSLAGFRVSGNFNSLEMDGFPAREYRILNSGGAVVAVRMVVAGSRMYILIAGGGPNPPEEQSVQRFFNSFTVTDKNLRNEADTWRIGSANDRSLAIASASLQRITADVERKRMKALGAALGNKLFETVAAEMERAQANVQSIAIASAFLRGMAADLERSRMKALGIALGGASIQTIAELIRHAEQNRIAKNGYLVGGAVTSSIETALRKPNKP